MSEDTFTIRAGDTAPALVADLTYEDGSPVILTGATVHLRLRNPEATVVLFDKACTFTGNTVTYTWASADTATAGEFVADFLVTFSDSSQRTFPTSGYFPVKILPKLTGTTKPRPAYLTTQDLIDQTRVYLDGRTRPGRNKLASAVDSSAESLTFKYDVAGASPGMTLTVGLETVYVWEAAGKTLTVERGTEGTVPSSHAADDVILLDPEFTDARILTALNLELAALPSEGVYSVKSLDRTLTANTTGYDLANDVVKVLDVRWQDPCDATQWTPVETFEVARDMPAAQFPSGVALLLPERPFVDQWVNGPANALRIRYRSTFGTLTTLYDDVLTVTAIPASAVDILPLGAAIRLLAGRAVPQIASGAQPDPRNSAEVTVTSILNAPAALRQQRDRRVQDEADKLAAEWVWRKPARTLLGPVRSRRWGRW